VSAAAGRRAARLAALAALAAAAALALLAGSEPARVSAPAPIEPLRIASGNGIATGFAVGEGRLVTVAHVLDGPVTVRGHPVRVLRVDRRSDLALLSAPGTGGAKGVSAALPGIADAAGGQHLRVLRLRSGRPSSLSVHVRRSIVAHVRAPGATRPVVRAALELSALERGGHVAAGDSGAAVVMDSGDVAGIVFAASRSRADTAYAVDAGELRRLLR
jgi:hypothetical protein